MNETNNVTIRKQRLSIGAKGSVLIVLAVFGIMCFLLEMRTPRYFTWDDNVTQLLPAFVYNWRVLIESGEIPHINFHQWLGANHLRFSQAAVFYPPVYFSLLLSRIFGSDYSCTIDIYVITHLLFSVIFFFSLVRKTTSPLHAAMLALLWITTPFIIFLPRSWGTISVLFAFMPLSFLVLQSLIEKPSAKTIAVFSVTKTLFFFSGHADWFFRLTFFEVLYIVFFHPQIIAVQSDSFFKWFISHLKILRPFFAAYALTILLSAPLLLPSIAAKYESEFRSNFLSFSSFLDFRIKLIPFLCTQIGYFTPETVFGSNSCIFFVGPFFLALIAFIFIKLCKGPQKWHQWRWSVLSLAALILSTVFCIVLYFVPIMNNFRWPFKYFAFFIFFGYLAIAHFFSQGNFKRSLYICFLVLTLGANGVIIYNYPHNTFASNHAQTEPEPIFEDIMKKGRIVCLNVLYDDNSAFLKCGTNNYATLYGGYAFAGWDFLVSKLHHQLTLGLNHESIFNGKITPHLLHYLSFWGVRYIVTGSDHETEQIFESNNTFELIFKKNELNVYENQQAFPFVYAVNEHLPKIVPTNTKTGQIPIGQGYLNSINEFEKREVRYRFGVNEINIFTESSPAILVVNIAPIKGYKIWFDEKLAGEITEREMPVQITVPEGVIKVTLKFRETTFSVSLILFAAGIFILLGLFIKWDRPIIPYRQKKRLGKNA